MNLDVELQGLTNNLKIEDGGNSFLAKRGQITGVISLMLQGLANTEREMRIAVLNLFVGPAMQELYNVPVNSTNDITEPMALFLIRQLKEPFTSKDPDAKDPWELSSYGRGLLRLAEERAETSLEVA